MFTPVIDCSILLKGIPGSPGFHGFPGQEGQRVSLKLIIIMKVAVYKYTYIDDYICNYHV